MTLSAGHGKGLWSTAAWRHLAVVWLDEQLAVTGSQRIGYVGQPHLRPWLKACGPATAFEVGLYGLIGRVAPEHALSPIAADLAPGWIILLDGGPSLGDRFTGSDLADAMEAALAAYGHLQRTIAPHAGDQLDLGITDMRPAIMPRRFEEALQAVGARLRTRGNAAERAASAGYLPYATPSLPGAMNWPRPAHRAVGRHPSTRDAARGTLAAAVHIADGLAPHLGTPPLAVARGAFTQGLHTAAMLGAAIAITLAAAAVLRQAGQVPRPRATRARARPISCERRWPWQRGHAATGKTRLGRGGATWAQSRWRYRCRSTATSLDQTRKVPD